MLKTVTVTGDRGGFIFRCKIDDINDVDIIHKHSIKQIHKTDIDLILSLTRLNFDVISTSPFRYIKLSFKVIKKEQKFMVG